MLRSGILQLAHVDQHSLHGLLLYVSHVDQCDPRGIESLQDLDILQLVHVKNLHDVESLQDLDVLQLAHVDLSDPHGQRGLQVLDILQLAHVDLKDPHGV